MGDGLGGSEDVVTFARLNTGGAAATQTERTNERTILARIRGENLADILMAVGRFREMPVLESGALEPLQDEGALMQFVGKLLHPLHDFPLTKCQPRSKAGAIAIETDFNVQLPEGETILAPKGLAL